MLYVRQINTNQFKCEIILDRFIKFEWGINTQNNEIMTKSNLNPNQITKQRPFIYTSICNSVINSYKGKNCPKINIFAVFVSCLGLDVNFIVKVKINK